jgi:hypothetical protein
MAPAYSPDQLMNHPRRTFPVPQPQEAASPAVQSSPTMSTKSKTPTRSSRCQICRHPERTRIELMRASGVSLDVIASKFNVGLP